MAAEMICDGCGKRAPMVHYPKKLRCLDLFCGAGGAAKGLQRAGFYVVGVDIKPQPRYCGDEFHQADAMTFPLDGFDFIWASPPCQAYCALRHLMPDRTYPDLVALTRNRIVATGEPFVIENVPKSPLVNPIMLCGSLFGLRVRRHRMFESSITLPTPRPRRHHMQGRPIDVSGTGGRRITRRRDDRGGNTNKPRNLSEARRAIGIDWMNRYEISQSVPPAYSEWIGRHVMANIESGKAAG